MAAQPKGNEGIRLLDELVCQAIPASPDRAGEGPGARVGRGENAGMHVCEELILTPAGNADALGSPERTLSTDLPRVEIVIDRDFASYTAEQQAGLLAALRELLIVTGELRVLKRIPAK